MADRTITTRLRLDVSQFVAGESKAKGSLNNLNRQFAETAGAAEGFRKKLEASFKRLPDIKITADSLPAEVKLAELRARMQTLAAQKIGVDIDASAALVQMAAIQAELQELEGQTSFEVRADVGKALADIESVIREVQRLDNSAVQVPVEVEIRGGAFAERLRAQVDAAARSLPKIPLDADSTPAQRQVADLRARLESLGSKRVGIDIDAASAIAQVRSIESELSRIDGDSATIDIRADAASAAAALAVISGEVSRLDGRTANARVNVDIAGALAAIGTVAAALAGLAAVPALASVGFAAAGLGAAFGAAGVGAASFAAVAVPSLGRVNEALKEQESASRSAGGAGKSLAASQAEAAARALQLAEAQNRVRDAAVAVVQAKRALRSAIDDVTRAQEDERRASDDLARAVEDGARRHAEALRQVEDGERAVRDAQADALRAQEALNDARREEERSLQDLGNRLIDTRLDQRQAAVDLQDAEARLNATRADPRATPKDIERAEIAYERAKQRVTELQISIERLQQEQSEADKNGVEGSDRVKNAKDALEQANRRIEESERALAETRANVARVDEESARRVADSQRQVAESHRRVADAQAKVIDSQERLVRSQRDAEMAARRLKVEQLQAKAAMEQTGGSAGGAITKMSQLSKAEKELAKDMAAFKTTYEDWQKSLQPDVFPVISGGLDLIADALPKLNPLVRGAAAGFTLLEKRAGEALKDPFWDEFIRRLSAEIPGAIDDFGAAALNVGKGAAGMIQAFLPYAGDLTDWVVGITKRFADWGTNLETSPGFKAFVAYAQANLPKVQKIVENIGTAVAKILQAAAAPGQGALDFLVGLSQKLAELSPDQIQAIAGGIGAIFTAAKLGTTIKLGGFLVLADVLSEMSPGQIQALAGAIVAVMLAVKGYQTATDAIEFFQGLRGEVGKAGDAAGAARGKFSGLGGVLQGAGIAAGITAIAAGVGLLDDKLSGLSPNMSNLTRHLGDWVKGGKPAADVLDQIQGKISILDPRGLQGIGDVVQRMSSGHWWDELDTQMAGFANTLGGKIGVTLDHGTKRVQNLDQAMASMVASGNPQEAAKLFDAITKQAQNAGTPLNRLKDLFPQYTDAVGKSVQPTNEAGSAIDTAKQKLDGFNTSLSTFSGRTDAFTALQNMRQAYNDARDAIDAANGKLDINAQMTDKQRDAVIRARDMFVGYLERVRDGADAQAKLSGKTTDATRTVLEQLPKLSDLAGSNKEARAQVLLLADAYGISRSDALKAMEGGKKLKEVLDKLKSKQIRIDMETKAAEEKLKKLYDWQLKILGVNTKLPETIAAPKTKTKADGGVSFNPYAAGGIAYFASGAENHIAQIAPAGAMRVWAEPETGGESYIPLAPSKRERSTQILAATAQIMGYQLMPAGKLALIAMAAGGLVAGQRTPVLSTGPATGGLTVSIDNLGQMTASLDAVNAGLNEQLAGATGVLTSTISETGTLTKTISSAGQAAGKVATTTGQAATTTASGTAKLTTAITSLTKAITSLTAAVNKAGSLAGGGAGSKAPAKKTTATKKPAARTDPNDVTYDRGPTRKNNTGTLTAELPPKPSNQVEPYGGSGDGSGSIVGAAAYAGALAGVGGAAGLIGASAGRAFGSVMAGSAAQVARSLPLNGTGSGGTQARSAQRSAPQMGGGGASYSGVYGAGAAQSGSLAGRLAHDAATGTAGSAKSSSGRDGPLIENFYAAPNSSPRQLAEELNFLQRRR
ncbi:hypothetical protein Ssi03_50450 [Sphaerisporangium siamense]|uniref:Chromosome segregation ATPase n=1 Tax=Sphaerisporangium siamense TaxID=795645 RepID=A0A7W7GCR5_9ACTN|nr:hypothetical protein [Sphaerisporangium siamense]MBB4702251.1 chromosome segregation ATPase [Sphaerisporangium siamense]GII87055.1 hypothetical protein Ssi03_50450 [Sphaerisporangium siamense]